MRDLITAAEVHGESGLEGPELPDPSFDKSEKTATELMVKIISESEEKVTLIPTGPLTNIGHLLLAHPELKDKIEEIVLMGGACFGGNWTLRQSLIFLWTQRRRILCISRVYR